MLEEKPRTKPSENPVKKSKRADLDPRKLREITGWRRFVRWRYILPVIALLVVLLGVYGFFTAKTVLNHVNSGVAHIQTAIDQVKNDSASMNVAAIDKLKQELSASETDFRQAREAAGPVSFFLPLVGWLPGPAYDLSKLPGFLEIAEKTSKSGVLVLDGVTPALAPFDSSSGATGSGPAGATASGKLTQAATALAKPEAQANFKQASALMNDVAALRANLDPSKLSLGQTRKAIDQLDQQLPALRDGLQLAQDLPPLLPNILGTGKPVTYLTLMQNSDELRATGGFISAVGLLTLDNGKLSLSNFSDSYAVDNPNVKPESPPPALARYMQAGWFLLRDANWWPDFPTSAKKIADLYKLHQGATVDNVLALDSRTVAYLFEALGPLDLPSYNEHLTADNFEERLRFYYQQPGTDPNSDWWLKRKEFMGVVMNGLLGKLNGATARDYIKLVNALGKAASEKHLQIYAGNPDLEKQLSQRKLDGAILPPVPVSAASNLNDFLMLVDTNVGFNKVTPNVDRTASYTISSGGTGANLFASLTLTYTSRAGVREGTDPNQCVKVTKYDSSYESMMNGCYWNYLRVYVPAGSTLRDTSGFAATSSQLDSNNFPTADAPVTGQENGRTYFAAQLVVPPGQTVTVTLNYVLPGTLPDKPLYRLDVELQAGAKASPLSVKVNWPGYTKEWKVQLDRDLTFSQS